MRNLILFGMAVPLTCLLTIIPGSRVLAGDMTIDIQVSPATILIGADDGQWVTVHTNVPFAEVAAATVTLNDVPVDWVKSDAQGNFVAKFECGAVRALDLGTGDVLLTLSGTTVDDVAFSGSDMVRVVEFSGTEDPPGK